MPRARRLVLLAALLLVPASCVTPRQYRTSYDVCRSPADERCDTAALHRHPEDDVLLGFVELDEQGLLWDPRQLLEVTNALVDEGARAGATEDLLLVVYVHGWKHDAAPDDADVARFERDLALIRRAELANSDKAPPRSVAGVFVGWRGDSVRLPGIRELSFWDRKNTAHAVGRNGATEVLLAFEEVKTSIESTSGREVTLVFVGHSLGGAVLYTALSQILLERFMNPREGKDGPPEPLGDLVVLINPAFEALRYAALRDAVLRRNTGGGGRPVLAVLTSEADWATKYAFPLGRACSTFFQRERVMSTPSGDIDQEEANRTAIGHFAPFRTHRLEPLPMEDALSSGEDESDRLIRRMNATVESWSRGYERGTGTIDFVGSRLIPEPGAPPGSQYLVVQVDEEILPDHDTIDGERVLLFLQGLIRARPPR